MAQERHPQAACARKKQYLTYLHAQHDARRLRRKDGTVQAYHCTVCGFAHVGNVTKRDAVQSA